jgi:protein-tyrosine phosphatase
MPNILVLCRANQFRSVLTEYALRRRLDSAEWRVSSAGVWAQDGLPAARGLAAWSEMLELEQHRSRALDFAMLQDADLVLVMERGQKEALALEFPMAAGRVYLLSEMSEPVAYDIPDPALGGENPGQLIAEILSLVEKGLPRIIQLSEDSARTKSD